MSEQRQNPEDNEKLYEAPKVIRVSLRPDEAVLGHCKTPTASGGPATMSPCGISIGGCKSFGS